MHEDSLSSELSWGVLFQKKLRTLVELSPEPRPPPWRFSGLL